MCRQVEFQVVARVQVQAAFAVDVEEAGPGPHLFRQIAAGRGSGDPGPRGDVGERAVAVIAVQDVGAEIAEVDVGPAVVVIVRHGDSQTERRTGHAGLLAHVTEPPSAEVLIEGVPRRPCTGCPRQHGAVGKINVNQAVAVVIERGQAGRHRLGDVVPAARSVEVLERDPGRRRDIDQPDGEGRGIRFFPSPATRRRRGRLRSHARPLAVRLDATGSLYPVREGICGRGGRGARRGGCRFPDGGRRSDAGRHAHAVASATAATRRKRVDRSTFSHSACYT